MFNVATSQVEDAALIEPHLEEDTRAEALAWVEPGQERQLIEEGIRWATEAYTLWECGQPIGIMAYRLDTMASDKVAPWAVWTDKAQEHPRRQARMARAYYDELVSRFGEIRNFFRDDRPRLHKWAGLMGAEVLRNTGMTSPNGQSLAEYVRRA